MSVAIPARVGLLSQLLATIAILAWVPGNTAKLAAFVIVWAIGFGRISRPEIVMMVGINILFAFMNYGALREGVFQFNNPDLLGMPMYEFVMWGFYVLNTIRFLDGNTPKGNIWVAVVLAALFAVPFSTISNAAILTLVTGLILVIGIVLYHEPLDLAYIGYMVAMGALIEYVGVSTGQWSYPGNPPGGVPLWFITMWGGVGLFTRRLLVPMLLRPVSTSPSA